MFPVHFSGVQIVESNFEQSCSLRHSAEHIQHTVRAAGAANMHADGKFPVREGGMLKRLFFGKVAFSENK